jgi:hypothetical protein
MLDALDAGQALNGKPKELSSVDVMRVREWALNGWGRFYRQTLIFR